MSSTLKPVVYIPFYKKAFVIFSDGSNKIVNREEFRRSAAEIQHEHYDLISDLKTQGYDLPPDFSQQLSRLSEELYENNPNYAQWQLNEAVREELDSLLKNTRITPLNIMEQEEPILEQAQQESQQLIARIQATDKLEDAVAAKLESNFLFRFVTEIYHYSNMISGTDESFPGDAAMAVYEDSVNMLDAEMRSMDGNKYLQYFVCDPKKFTAFYMAVIDRSAQKIRELYTTTGLHTHSKELSGKFNEKLDKYLETVKAHLKQYLDNALDTDENRQLASLVPANIMKMVMTALTTPIDPSESFVTTPEGTVPSWSAEPEDIPAEQALTQAEDVVSKVMTTLKPEDLVQQLDICKSGASFDKLVTQVVDTVQKQLNSADFSQIPGIDAQKWSTFIQTRLNEFKDQVKSHQFGFYRSFQSDMIDQIHALLRDFGDEKLPRLIDRLPAGVLSPEQLQALGVPIKMETIDLADALGESDVKGVDMALTMITPAENKVLTYQELNPETRNRVKDLIQMKQQAFRTFKKLVDEAKVTAENEGPVLYEKIQEARQAEVSQSMSSAAPVSPVKLPQFKGMIYDSIMQALNRSMHRILSKSDPISLVSYVMNSMRTIVDPSTKLSSTMLEESLENLAARFK